MAKCQATNFLNHWRTAGLVHVWVTVYGQVNHLGM